MSALRQRRGDEYVVAIHIKKGHLELRLFVRLMTFGTSQDVTLQELRIESFFRSLERVDRWLHEIIRKASSLSSNRNGQTLETDIRSFLSPFCVPVASSQALGDRTPSPVTDQARKSFHGRVSSPEVGAKRRDCLPRRTFLAARQRHLNRRLAPGPP